MEITTWESGGHRIVKNLIAVIYVVSFCFLANLSVRAGDAGTFTKAIEQAKQFVVPVVCYGFNRDTQIPYLISVEGTGFFVSGDSRVITAGHVGAAILKRNRIPTCAIAGIYVPIEGWDSSSAEVRIRYVPITDCLVGNSLDIAVCYLAENLAEDTSIKKQPTAADLDSSIFPDGTPMAFTGFPLSFVQPITSQGIIGAYRGSAAALGPTELVVDKNAWPGASGSPIFEINGRVIGMIIQRGSDEAAGLAFAIPSAVVKKFLSDNPPAKKQDEPKDQPKNQQH
jgi:hypothetical protein